MTITADQIRSARALLYWSSPTIAKRSKVVFATVLKAHGLLGGDRTGGGSGTQRLRVTFFP